MSLFKILFIIAIALCVCIYLYILILKPCKFKGYHAYEADDLLNEKKEASSKNYIYEVRNSSKKFIQRYIIRKSKYDTSVICNYTNNYNDIAYFVSQYNKRRKLINMVKVRECATNECSRIIKVSKRTRYVNIWISSVDNVLYNGNEFVPAKRRSILFYSFLRSLSFLSIEYIFLYLLVFFIFKEAAMVFLRSYYFLGLAGAAVLFALLFFILGFIKRKRKNWKFRGRSKVTYEFI